MRGLAGKVAIVTGAASDRGIGFAAARRLCEEGARVVLTDCDASAVSARAAALVASGHDARACTHDVAVPQDWDVVVADAVDAYGGLDILVNNAGVALLGPLATYEDETWRQQIDVNLTGVFLGCRAAIGPLRARGGGAIVNVASIAGLVGMVGASVYGASKGGVRQMSRALALELASDAIRVNVVHPGVIRTGIQKNAFKEGPELAARIKETIPVGRMGEPDDVAAAIAFLASDDAGYLTGTEITVDGGFTAR